MARKTERESLPHQQRFPSEGDCNTTRMTTARPLGELTEQYANPSRNGLRIPTPVLMNTPNFMFESHTNGKKKE